MFSYESVVWCGGFVWATLRVCTQKCVCFFFMHLFVSMMYEFVCVCLSCHVLKRIISRCNKSPRCLSSSAKITIKKQSLSNPQLLYFFYISSVHRQITFSSSFQWFVTTIIIRSVPLALNLCVQVYLKSLCVIWTSGIHILATDPHWLTIGRIMRSQELKWQSGLQ